MGVPATMYSVAMCESDKACKTIYTYDKAEAVDCFVRAVGVFAKVVLYHGSRAAVKWEGTKQSRSLSTNKGLT